MTRHSEFYREGESTWRAEGQRMRPPLSFDLLSTWVGKYRLSHETAWRRTIGKAGNSDARLGDRVQLVGDDLSSEYQVLEERIEGGWRIRFDQGQSDRTLTENFQRKQRANRTLYGGHMHRSGEERGHTIADLCVATQAMQIRTAR